MKRFVPVFLIIAIGVTECNVFNPPTPVPSPIVLPSPTRQLSSTPLPTSPPLPSPTVPLAVNPTLVAQLPVATTEPIATAWSPDGNSFALAQLQRGITLFKSQDFKPLWSMPFDAAMVSFFNYTPGDPISNQHGVLTFSPDGQWLATAHTDNSVRVWNTATGQLQFKFSVDFQPGSFAFTPDSNLLAVGELNTKSTESGPGRPAQTQVWNIKNGKVLATVTGRANSAPSIFFADSKTLVIHEQIIDSDARGHPATLRAMQLTDAGTSPLWEKKNRLQISSVQINPDGKTVTVVLADDTVGNQHVTSWDVQTGNEVFTWKPTTTPGAIYLYPNPSRNLFGAWATREKMIHILENDTGRKVRTWTLPTSDGNSDARFAFFSPSGKILAREVWSWPQRKGTQSAQAQFFADETGKLLKTMDDAWLYPSLGNSPFNAKTGWLATRGNDGAVKIWSGVP